MILVQWSSFSGLGFPAVHEKEVKTDERGNYTATVRNARNAAVLMGRHSAPSGYSLKNGVDYGGGWFVEDGKQVTTNLDFVMEKVVPKEGGR